jgi:hypothetical protein
MIDIRTSTGGGLDMRTTLTLDPDVAALLRRHMREHKTGLKEAVNRALRKGLQSDAPALGETPYRVTPWKMGPHLISIDCVGEALAIAEAEDHK